MAKLKVTQIRSIIDSNHKHKKTIEALGLGRPNYFKILPDNPQTRGMVAKVVHLVKVESVNE